MYERDYSAVYLKQGASGRGLPSQYPDGKPEVQTVFILRSQEVEQLQYCHYFYSYAVAFKTHVFVTLSRTYYNKNFICKHCLRPAQIIFFFVCTERRTFSGS